MQLGMIGLGRMGANLVRRLTKGGHKCVVYDVNPAAVKKIVGRGSIIGSWLLDLTAAALRDTPDLKGFAGRMSDCGEGCWMIAAAIDEAVPVSVPSAALYERFGSRGDSDFANRLSSAMRKQFGGHHEKKEAQKQR